LIDVNFEIIKDKLLDTVTEINNTDKFYTVTLSADLSDIGRFYLHTQDNSSTLAIDDFTASKYLLIATPETQNLKLYGTVAEKGLVNIYDSLGRMIYTTSLKTGTEQDINVLKISTGVYFVKFKIDEKLLAKKSSILTYCFYFSYIYYTFAPHYLLDDVIITN